LAELEKDSDVQIVFGDALLAMLEQWALRHAAKQA